MIASYIAQIILIVTKLYITYKKSRQPYWMMRETSMGYRRFVLHYDETKAFCVMLDLMEYSWILDNKYALRSDKAYMQVGDKIVGFIEVNKSE